MISMLFMSVDGAADIAFTGHPHGGEPTHLIDKHAVASMDFSLGVELDIDHCEHCCHGHTFSISVQMNFALPMLVTSDQRIVATPCVRNFA